jgi:hypothetical protein
MDVANENSIPNALNDSKEIFRLSRCFASKTGNWYAFEFRDSSWMEPAAYEAMKMFGVAFCIYHLPGKITPKEVTCIVEV